MFGLDIKYRRPDCQFFDFDIEEFICFTQFAQLCKFPSDCGLTYDKNRWIDFIDQHCMLKTDIIEYENDKKWRYLAYNQTDVF